MFIVFYQREPLDRIHALGVKGFFINWEYDILFEKIESQHIPGEPIRRLNNSFKSPG